MRTEGISFYLDGVGLAYKSNPMDAAHSSIRKAYLRGGETLSLNCTAKGSHEWAGGKTAHFIAAIAYGKGFILSEQYQGNMDGEELCRIYSYTFQECA